MLGTTISHTLSKFVEPIPRNCDSISIALFAKASLEIWLGIYPNAGIQSLIGLPLDECI